MRLSVQFATALLGGACLVGLAGAALAQDTSSTTLDVVKARGYLVCGISGTIEGFSLLDSHGEMKGIEADVCRSIATAIFGHASKVNCTLLTTQNRYTALQSAEVDVLSAPRAGR